MHNAQFCGAIGRLMSPQEVYAATLSRSDIPSDIKHEWFLCGGIPEAMWDALRDGTGGVGFRLSAFTAPEDTGYVCFTVQILHSQARFLLPLGSERVEWFLKEASLCGLHLSVARNNGDSAIVRKFGVAPSDVIAVLELAQRCRDLTGQDLITDFVFAVAAIGRTATIPSIFEGVAVSDVQVIVVPPQ
ncbi:hypothetical protein BZG29_02165 [Janthinobacterium sp. LM6]|uniref:hypothetical protein n=1 Tax=Janthinobacterium sp. LM6 TaxID=1938606 RepID=UPI000983D428|nr:hypothetical protein [Janthinobacterium sp. LM6]AQR67293.1 hypothetical protein BZG29_02165 [Janthinobacterium sp. LM6]